MSAEHALQHEFLQLDSAVSQSAAEPIGVGARCWPDSSATQLQQQQQQQREQQQQPPQQQLQGLFQPQEAAAKSVKQRSPEVCPASSSAANPGGASVSPLRGEFPADMEPAAGMRSSTGGSSMDAIDGNAAARQMSASELPSSAAVRKASNRSCVAVTCNG